MLVDRLMLEGFPNSEAYEKLLTFQPPEEKDDVYQLPPAKYNELLPFITVRVEHPAVMNPYLATFLWRRYVKPGDIVIDPMAGVGGTPGM